MRQDTFCIQRLVLMTFISTSSTPLPPARGYTYLLMRETFHAFAGGTATSSQLPPGQLSESARRDELVDSVFSQPLLLIAVRSSRLPCSRSSRISRDAITPGQPHTIGSSFEAKVASCSGWNFSRRLPPQQRLQNASGFLPAALLFSLSR